MSDSEHPARLAGLLSQKHVSEGNRDAWLDLFAEEAVVADPVGPSPLDPEGRGHRGKPAIAEFYDKIISKAKVSFDYPRSYACGDEVANVGSITIVLPNGAVTQVDGVFTYRVDDSGKVKALRAYWEFPPRIFPPAGG